MAPTADEQNAPVELERPHRRQPSGPTPRAGTWSERAVVAALTLLVASQLSVRSLLSATTPTGGDVGAHVWFPAFLHDHLLPGLNGWSDDWFAGFPAGLFYFPLPALLTVAADIMLPYGLAMKLVVVAGSLLLPTAVWRFARTAGAPLLAAVGAAAAATVFLFDQWHQIYGGNIASALAGMFSYSLGVTLTFFALAELNLRAAGRGNHWRLIGFSAAAALCHLLTAVVLAVLAVVVVLAGGPRLAGRVKRSVGGLTSAALITGAWSLPMLLHLGYTTDMGYERVTVWAQWLLPFSSDEFPAAQTWHTWLWVLVIPAALVAAIVARQWLLRVSLAGAASFALLFRFLPGTTVWNARWLPPMYLCLYVTTGVVAGVAVQNALVWLRDRSEDRAVPGADRVLARRWATHGVPAFALAGLLCVPVLVAVGFVPSSLPGVPAEKTSTVSAWSRWNFDGYERKPDWGEYQVTMDVADRLGRTRGCGRALWEYDETQGSYGTPMAMMLLPYWTGGCIDSVEGLYFESSLTTPYHFMTQVGVSQNGSRAVRRVPYPQFDLEWGVRAMRQLGVRYYMTFMPATTEAARQHPGLVEVAEAGPWVFFELADHAIVAPAIYAPVVISRDELSAPLSQWAAFRADPDALIAVEGAGDWPVRSSVAEAVATSRELRSAELPAVSNVTVTSSEVSFDVDRAGMPVLVRMSWFPSWRATGADGPYQAGPNMMVVVPTDTKVTLTAGSAPGTTAGWMITAAGIAAAAALTASDRRRRARHDAETAPA